MGGDLMPILWFQVIMFLNLCFTDSKDPVDILEPQTDGKMAL